jgi:type IV pilus assembly protein PilB
MSPPLQMMREAGCPPAGLASGEPVYEPVGCERCLGGYLGRIGVFQVMPVSAAMAELVLKDAAVAELARQAAQEGVMSLRQSAWRKVKLGQTSIEEVLAHTHA